MSARRPIRPRRWIPAALLVAVGAALALLRPASGGSPATASDPTAKGHAMLADLSSVDDAARLGDGWAIVDTRERVLHVMDAQGRLLRQIGRRGEGPGEFTRPQLVATTDDHVFVAQMGHPSLSRFDHHGAFINAVPAISACGTGTVASLAAAGGEVVAVRRCLEPPQRVRLQLERLISGALHPWGAADSIPLTSDGALPVTIPLLALDGRTVLFGDGGSGCLRRIDLASGVSSARRCLDWLPRLPSPESERGHMRTRSGARIALPDSLPRLWRIAMVDSLLAAVVSEGQTRFRWVWVDEAPDRRGIVPFGRAFTFRSFVDRGAQLVATEEDDGIHLEVLRVRR